MPHLVRYIHTHKLHGIPRSVLNVGESFLMLLFQTEHQFCVQKVARPATESCYIILRSVCGVLEVQLGLLDPFSAGTTSFKLQENLGLL